MSRPIHLLVVDDSVYMRMAIRAMVQADPEIEVVGEAVDGEQAVEMAAQLTPDVITMDIAMPVLDGMEATRRIMAASPAPIIMLSSLTEKGVVTTFQALELGAVDYVPKSSSAIDIDLATIAEQVAAKIRFWGHRKTAPAAAAGVNLPAIPAGTDLLVVAAGPGGAPLAGELMRGATAMPFPALILQDMPANFTSPFVQYLGRTCGHPTEEGTHGCTLAIGTLTVMPGGRGGTLSRKDGTFTLDLSRSPGRAGDVVVSAVAAAKAPLVILLAGDHQETLARLAADWGDKGGAVWMSPAKSASPTGPGQAVGKAPLVVLDHGQLIAALQRCTDRAAA